MPPHRAPRLLRRTLLGAGLGSLVTDRPGTDRPGTGRLGTGRLTTQAEAREVADRPVSEDADVTATAAVVTRHSGIFNGTRVDYIATAGRSPLAGLDGQVAAQVFFVASTRTDAAPGSRPVTFAVNGGPGAGTAWLHLGALGPQKVSMRPDGTPPPPPARLEDNHLSPLDKSDLVFVDTPGTGYSRVADEAAKRRLFDVQGDIDALVTFIKSYLSANGRWGSPIYLFGESYGGTRVAGLSDALVQQGVPVSGVILLSAALDFLLLNASMMNDLPYVMLIPSYAAVAAFHGRLAPSLPRDVPTLIRTAQDWALGDYSRALTQAELLSSENRARAVDGLIGFTGLSRQVVEQADLRVSVPTFMNALLADQHLVTGRVDGRLTGPQPLNAVQEPWYDPAMGALTPAYSAAAEQYMTGTLNYRSSIPYRMYSRDVDTRFVMAEAQQDDGAGGYPQTLTSLQSAIVKNPSLRVLVMGGIYDLASPFWSTEYEVAHMRLPPDYARNVTIARLTSGHMAYNDAEGAREMSAAVSRFLKNTS